MSRVLVVSPHPDDEALGCGGTLHQHARMGDRVDLLFLTSGERGGHGLGPAETALLREAEAEAGALALGAATTTFWRLPDGGLRLHRPLVDRLRDHLAATSPDLVYTTHPGEMHADHRAAARLVAHALDRLPAGAPPPVAWGFEVWTPIARLDRIVDITADIAAKRAAIRCHRSQCRVVAFAEAMVGLARYRGEMHCWPEGDYAEVFIRLAPVRS